VESQQLAVTRQGSVNNNRGIVFSAQSLPMAAHAAVEYVVPLLSNSCAATEERCFLRGPCRYIISRTSEDSVSLLVSDPNPVCSH
jgi:hypothetical protein